jgi:hypothetical protein
MRQYLPIYTQEVLFVEVPKIEDVRLNIETEKPGDEKVADAAVAENKRCIYRKEVICAAPDCQMEICDKCQYGCKYSFASTVKDVFSKIVSLAIFFAKSDDILKDVVSLLSKSKEAGSAEREEGSGIKEKGSGMREDGGGIKELGNVNEERFAENEKLEENIELLERAELHIKTAEIAERPAAKKVAGIRTMIAADIAQKIASIDDALGPRPSSGQANSSGSREKPLV